MMIIYLISDKPMGEERSQNLFVPEDVQEAPYFMAKERDC